MASDVEAVLDKRRGRLEDYRVDSKLRGKMIGAWVLELAECGQASGAAVAQRLIRLIRGATATERSERLVGQQEVS